MTRSPRRLRKQVRDTVSELPIHAARLAVMGVGRALLLTDRVRKDYRDARQSGLGPVLGRLRNDAENLTGTVVGKVAGDGRRTEEPKTRARDSEISVGKPKPAAGARPKPAAKPAAKKDTSKAGTSKASTPKAAAKPTPKPAAAKGGAAKATTAKAGAAKAGAAKAEAPKAAAAKPKPTESKATKPKTAETKPAEAKPTETKATETKATETRPAKPAESKPAKPASPAAKAEAPKAEAPKAEAPKAPAAKAPTGNGLPLAGYDQATLASVRARLRNLDTRQVTELRDYERSHAARADFLRMYENRIAKLREER